MSITYNDVEIKLLTINRVERTPIFDDSGCDYLYTRWVIDCIGYLNKDYMSHDVEPGANNGAFFGQLKDGSYSPVTTDQAIRNRLWTQRKKLLFKLPSKVGAQGEVVDQPGFLQQQPQRFPIPPNQQQNFNVPALDQGKHKEIDDDKIFETLLEVPANGQAVDALNGPIPLHVDLVRVVGGTTLVCHFAISAHINECKYEDSVASQKPPMLLSNRWTMTYDSDQQHIITRTIQGIAHFRTDFMYELDNGNIKKNERYPDELRKELFFPVPPNFQRMPVQVVQLPNLAAVQYTVVDHERLINFDNRGTYATNIEVFHRQALLTHEDGFHAGLSGVEQYAMLRANLRMAYMKDPENMYGQGNVPSNPGSGAARSERPARGGRR